MSPDRLGAASASAVRRKTRPGRSPEWGDRYRTVIDAIFGMLTESGAVAVYLVGLLIVSLAVARL